jgi:hypothetical protein
MNRKRTHSLALFSVFTTMLAACGGGGGGASGGGSPPPPPPPPPPTSATYHVNLSEIIVTDRATGMPLAVSGGQIDGATATRE